MKNSKTPAGITERIGVNAVEKIFLEDMGWFFREQAVSDWGVDAQVEIVVDGIPTGKLIALQIKTGSSYFRKKGEGYVYYGDNKHLSYWSNHSLPVFIIIHNPDTGLTLWQRIERHLVLEKNDRWSIDIPASQILTKNAATYLARGIASDANSLRRVRLTLDHDLIVEFSKKTVFFEVVEWVNKSLSFRETNVFFEDLDKNEPDISLNLWLPTHNLATYMEVYFPWLNYKYISSLEEDGSGELAIHKLEVTLNSVAKSYLALDKYYRNGLRKKAPPQPLPREDDSYEYDWHDESF